MNEKECAICLNEFSENNDVSPLPCDIRHYFHTDCIEQWFRQNTTCPLCKKEINIEDMEKMNKKFENREPAP